jgi:hypothetical protein
MTQKEIFVKLAEAYIDNFNKTIDLDRALSSFGLYITDEKNIFVGAIESILEEMTGSEYIVETLLQYAQGVDIYFYILEDGEEKEIICTSIEDIYDAMMKLQGKEE